jgi:hypothetical protein
MPGILTERQRIVNRSHLLRTDRLRSGLGGRPLSERREQTVDQAGELAAGIVVGVNLGHDPSGLFHDGDGGCDGSSMH